MKDIQLKGTKITELSFINKLENNSQITIGNKYSYNVRYAPNNICVGEFTAELADSQKPDKFLIKLTYAGIFSYPESMARDAIHLKTYDMLVPYVRAAITDLTASAGIPPIYIPYIDISGEKIYSIKFPTKA